MDKYKSTVNRKLITISVPSTKVLIEIDEASKELSGLVNRSKYFNQLHTAFMKKAQDGLFNEVVKRREQNAKSILAKCIDISKSLDYLVLTDKANPEMETVTRLAAEQLIAILEDYDCKN